MNQSENRSETLKVYIAAATADINYCNMEIAKYKKMLNDSLNAGYARKEIDKTEMIIKSHQKRLAQYQTELCTLGPVAAENAEPSEMEQVRAEIAAAEADIAQFRQDHEEQTKDKPLNEVLQMRSKYSRTISEKMSKLDKLHNRVEQLEKAEKSKSFHGTKYKKCGRCGGHGSTIHTHVKHGVCFNCNGAGKVKTSAYREHLGETISDLPF